MGQVYPIARGTAPLMTAAGGALLVGENFSLAGWAGIVALTGGVFLLSLRGGGDLAHLNRRAVGFALFTAVTICCYSLVDGIGRAHRRQCAFLCAVAVRDRRRVHHADRARCSAGPPPFRRWRHTGKAAWPAASLSLTAYWIAIWAMTVAPIAMVAALRETSVLFGAAIAVVFLKEPLRAPRIFAAVLIVCGHRADPAAVTHPGEVPHHTPCGHIVPRMSGHRVCRNGRGTARCRRGAWDRGADCLRFRTIC